MSVIFLLISAFYAQKTKIIDVLKQPDWHVGEVSDSFNDKVFFSDYVNLMLDHHLPQFMQGLIVLGIIMLLLQLIFLFDKQKNKINIFLQSLLWFIVLFWANSINKNKQKFNMFEDWTDFDYASVHRFWWLLLSLLVIVGIIWIVWKYPGTLSVRQQIILWSSVILLGSLPLILNGCLYQQTKIDFLFSGGLTCLGIAMGTFCERFNNANIWRWLTSLVSASNGT